MSIFRFIFHSYIFRITVIVSMGFIIVLSSTNFIFDRFWKFSAIIPVINLDEFYQIPKSYNNISRINLKLLDKNILAVECNKKFRISKAGFDYYDTIKIEIPGEINPSTNKIFIHYQDSGEVDSLYLVLSKSKNNGIFWNQVFFSSVIVSKLNSFSNDTNDFRIHKDDLVPPNLLENNDTLLNQAIQYFNLNSDHLGLAECGTNSRIFESVCSMYHLPCRVISLQGGDALYDGFDTQLGYPLHVVCEVYSSRYKKWMVVDPTYGSIFKLSSMPLNAVEISNRFFFRNADGITQDSVMVTKKSILDKDYYKFYENVYYSNYFKMNYIVTKFLAHFFGNFVYKTSIYSNNMDFYKNGFNYFAVKAIVIIILCSLYFYIILASISRRLLIAKRKKEN